MPRPLQANVIACGSVLVYQLLCGRDIANPMEAQPQDREAFGAAKGMANYVYLIVNATDHTAIAVDAAWDVDGLYRLTDALGVRIAGAVYTHSHFDHCGGKVNPALTGGRAMQLPGAHTVAAHGGHLWANAQDAPKIITQCDLAADAVSSVGDGDVIAVGGLTLHTIHTPGHTPGSMCLFLSPAAVSPRDPATAAAGSTVEAASGVLITGDTLFIGSCGRTDLPGSDQSLMFQSLSRLSGLSPDVCVLPGHNYAPQPFSTILQERQRNPMMVTGLRVHPSPPGLPDCCAQGRMKCGPLNLNVGGRVKVTAGDAAGQVGVVRGYDAATQTYTVQLSGSGPSAVRPVRPADLVPKASAL